MYKEFPKQVFLTTFVNKNIKIKNVGIEGKLSIAVYVIQFALFPQFVISLLFSKQYSLIYSPMRLGQSQCIEGPNCLSN